MRKGLSSIKSQLIRITAFLIVVLIITSIGVYTKVESEYTSEINKIVTFPDSKLEDVIRQIIGKPTGDILSDDLSVITKLDASSKGISDLEGIENLINLKELYLKDNQIKDITPVSLLTKLTVLDISYNNIRHISALNSLTNLREIHFEYNQISDFSEDLINILRENNTTNEMLLGLYYEVKKQQTVLRDLGLESEETDKNIKDIFKNAVVLYIGSPKAYADYTETWIDTQDPRVMPIIENDRTLVPVRFISENFSASVNWDSKTSTATIITNENEVKIKSLDSKMLINNKEIKLDAPAKIINGRMFIPLRKLAENVLNKGVFYDRKLIILSSMENTPEINTHKQTIEDIIFLFKKNELQVTNLQNETQKEISTYGNQPQIEWAFDSKHFLFIDKTIYRGQVDKSILRVFDTEALKELSLPEELFAKVPIAYWLDNNRILISIKLKDANEHSIYDIVKNEIIEVSEEKANDYITEIKNRNINPEATDNIKMEIANIQSGLGNQAKVDEVLVSKDKSKFLYNIFTYADKKTIGQEADVVSIKTYLYDMEKATSIYLLDGFTLNWSPGESKLKYCVPKETRVAPFKKDNNYSAKNFETYIYDLEKEKSIKVGDFYNEKCYFSYDDKYVIAYSENYIRLLYL